MKFKNGTIVFALFCLAFAGNLFSADQAKSGKLVQVDAKKVCMVNNKAFDKDQIPVKVEDKTYYGCCEMCKKMLTENADARMAVDPVSGNKVDKATAVIGADSDGTTYYFENAANLEKFNEKSGS